jgi:hypothetical protein
LRPPPIPLPPRDLVPPPSLFWHDGGVHGQAYVARVMVHAFRLLEATGAHHLAPALWAAVYLHDIARQHDGHCTRHGADAWARLADLPEVQSLFSRGGVKESDYPAIETAVTEHCRSEVSADQPHGELAALLKDADGLDRVRLYDLDPGYLRHPQAVAMVPFAERLFEETDRRLQRGPDYFERLWPEAERIFATGKHPSKSIAVARVVPDVACHAGRPSMRLPGSQSCCTLGKTER